MGGYEISLKGRSGFLFIGNGITDQSCFYEGGNQVAVESVAVTHAV